MLVVVFERLRSISNDITFTALSDVDDKENHSDYFNVAWGTPSSAGWDNMKSTSNHPSIYFKIIEWEFMNF